MDPVLHWLTVVTVGAGAVTVTVLVGLLGLGAAAARVARLTRKSTCGRANILLAALVLEKTKMRMLVLSITTAARAEEHSTDRLSSFIR